MKKILLNISAVILLAAACNSTNTTFSSQNFAAPASQSASTTPVQPPSSTPPAATSVPPSQAMPPAVLNAEAGIFTRPTDAQIKAMLTPLQYQVTQEQGTEQPFDNAYWNNEQPGLYVDIVSGEPLFSSTDKYDSGTGWPSFTKPISPDAVIERADNSLGMERTEIISAIAKSHLGHLFNDGPLPLGTRYCMNSASLRFIPAADLKAQGYGKYSNLFQ